MHGLGLICNGFFHVQNFALVHIGCVINAYILSILEIFPGIQMLARLVAGLDSHGSMGCPAATRPTLLCKRGVFLGCIPPAALLNKMEEVKAIRPPQQTQGGESNAQIGRYGQNEKDPEAG